MAGFSQDLLLVDILKKPQIRTPVSYEIQIDLLYQMPIAFWFISKQLKFQQFNWTVSLYDVAQFSKFRVSFYFLFSVLFLKKIIWPKSDLAKR